MYFRSVGLDHASHKFQTPLIRVEFPSIIDASRRRGEGCTSCRAAEWSEGLREERGVTYMIELPPPPEESDSLVRQWQGNKTATSQRSRHRGQTTLTAEEIIH